MRNLQTHCTEQIMVRPCRTRTAGGTLGMLVLDPVKPCVLTGGTGTEFVPLAGTAVRALGGTCPALSNPWQSCPAFSILGISVLPSAPLAVLSQHLIRGWAGRGWTAAWRTRADLQAKITVMQRENKASPERRRWDPVGAPAVAALSSQQLPQLQQTGNSCILQAIKSMMGNICRSINLRE